MRFIPLGVVDNEASCQLTSPSPDAPIPSSPSHGNTIIYHCKPPFPPKPCGRVILTDMLSSAELARLSLGTHELQLALGRKSESMLF